MATGFASPSVEQGAGRFLAWLAGEPDPWLVVLDDVRRPGTFAASGQRSESAGAPSSRPVAATLGSPGLEGGSLTSVCSLR
jgi:hypothetical protein